VFAPCYLLLIVDFAEIENGSLHRFVGSDAMAFYNAEVAVIFTVFFAMDARQKLADGSLPEVRGQKEDTWSSLTVFSELGDGNIGLNYENYGNNAKNRLQVVKLGLHRRLVVDSRTSAGVTYNEVRRATIDR
jgi:hypothetical protein